MFIYVLVAARCCCAGLRCSRAIWPGSECGGCWRRISVWSGCYLSTLLQLHPLCTSPPSTCRDTSGRYQALRQSLFFVGAFSCFFIFIIFIWPLTFILLPLHLCPLWLFLLLSIFILRDKTSQQQTFIFIFLSHFWIFLFLVSHKQFSQLPSSLLLSSADPVHTNLQSEAQRLWSRTTAKQGSLMWPLWGSPAVGLVFNQAPGFNSQHARAPLTPTICGGCGGSQNPHALL